METRTHTHFAAGPYPEPCRDDPRNGILVVTSGATMTVAAHARRRMSPAATASRLSPPSPRSPVAAVAAAAATVWRPRVGARLP
jgi:hypothetical protein